MGAQVEPPTGPGKLLPRPAACSVGWTQEQKNTISCLCIAPPLAAVFYTPSPRPNGIKSGPHLLRESAAPTSRMLCRLHAQEKHDVVPAQRGPLGDDFGTAGAEGDCGLGTDLGGG